jgi:hypothetical protein
MRLFQGPCDRSVGASYAIYNGEPLWCPPPINGCNEVASSPYARVFDLPVGYFGVVYYLFMFCLAALLAFDPFSRALRLSHNRKSHRRDQTLKNESLSRV